MTMDATDGSINPLELIGRIGVIPVLTIDNIDVAVPLVRALVDGGLTAVEITLRTPAGLLAISRVAAEVPDALMGAGSVVSADLAAAAIDAGARFVVSPGLDEGVIATARARGVTVLPGVATPTELMRAVAMAVDTVKLFPAEVLGGTTMVRSLSAVWPAVRFVPTGGITLSTAAEFLAMTSVLAVGGSWMVPRHAVAERRWDDIQRAATTAAELGRTRT